MDVVRVVVVVFDGFAAVPIRFDAPANIFPKIARAAEIRRAKSEFVKGVWREGNRSTRGEGNPTFDSGTAAFLVNIGKKIGYKEKLS